MSFFWGVLQFSQRTAAGEEVLYLGVVQCSQTHCISWVQKCII